MTRTTAINTLVMSSWWTLIHTLPDVQYVFCLLKLINYWL